MERTLDIMAGQETAPAETPAGGTLSTDFSEQLILLGNRLTAIETAISALVKRLDREDETPTETEPETPAEDEAEPETPAESEDMNNEREAD